MGSYVFFVGGSGSKMLEATLHAAAAGVLRHPGAAIRAVIVDLDNGTIVKAECSVVTDLCKEFIAKLMTGYNLDNGPDMLLQRFDETYYGHAKRAIETAIKMIFTKYEEIKSQRRLKKMLEEG